MEPSNFSKLDLCEKEFEHFWKEKVTFETITSKKYFDLFVKCGYNDIRYIPMMNEATLNDDVEMKKLHLLLFMKNVEWLKKQNQSFQTWLTNLNKNKQSAFQEYFELFSNLGILTFDSLSRHIKHKNDFFKTGIMNEDDVSLLWNEMNASRSVQIDKGNDVVQNADNVDNTL